MKFAPTLYYSTILSGVMMAAPAMAQSTEAAVGPDIVVTATRSETLASKTPVALTAVSGDMLTAQGISNPTNLSEQVPSLSIVRNNGLQITIRGISSSDNTEKGDPSAAFMSDGIYIARSQAQEVSFFDISRVEVLRGPQGTLFGRNTTAGLVNLISNKPKLGYFGGSIDAAYGNYDTRQLTGVINVPVTEGIAVRAAVNYDYRDSYLKSGPDWESGLDPFKKNLSGRASALIDLGEGELLIRGDYSSLRGNPTNSLPIGNFYDRLGVTGVDPLYTGGGKSSSELRTVDAAFSSALGRKQETWGIMADFSYDLGPVTVNYLGSYREFNRHDKDSQLTQIPAFTVPTQFDGSYWQNSQELRISNSGSGPLKVQAGLYYFEEQSAVTLNAFGLLSPVPNTTGYVYSISQDPTTAKSWAGFGQLTYSITDSLRATAGIRYSRDEKSRDGFTGQCATTNCDQASDVLAVNAAKRRFSKTTWRAGLDYDVGSKTLVYANVATGYKAGGFNDGCQIGTSPACTLPADALYYEPETLTAYEAGLKTRLANNAVSLNLSAFHYDYKGIQLAQLTNLCGGPCAITTNAGRAKVDGVEVESVLAPTRNIKVDFAFTWLNARYTSFSPLEGVDWAGRKLDRSPPISLTAGYTHTIDLANGGNLQAGVRTMVSDSYKLASLEAANQFRVPSYTKTDLLLTYNAPNGSWYLQGYLKNIENSIVVTTATGGLFSSIQVADPRTYGVRAGVKF